MSHDTYMIPEGGVCNAFNTENQEVEAIKKDAVLRKASKNQEFDWDTVPNDFRARMAQVTEDINDSMYVPTQVLKDTLEKALQRHHGDELTTEEESTVKLIKDELKNRDDDPGYAG